MKELSNCELMKVNGGLISNRFQREIVVAAANVAISVAKSVVHETAQNWVGGQNLYNPDRTPVAGNDPRIQP